jgi:hypothetical protein
VRVLLASPDDGCIDDSISYHLVAQKSATREVAQAAETEKLGPINPYRLQMKPAAAQFSLPRSVVSSEAIYLDFISFSMTCSCSGVTGIAFRIAARIL